jgi:hypothetical protein
MQNLDEDEEIRLRAALAVALFALQLLAKNVLKPEDATRTLEVIEARYGYTPRNT